MFFHFLALVCQILAHKHNLLSQADSFLLLLLKLLLLPINLLCSKLVSAIGQSISTTVYQFRNEVFSQQAFHSRIAFWSNVLIFCTHLADITKNKMRRLTIHIFWTCLIASKECAVTVYSEYTCRKVWILVIVLMIWIRLLYRNFSLVYDVKYNKPIVKRLNIPTNNPPTFLNDLFTSNRLLICADSYASINHNLLQSFWSQGRNMMNVPKFTISDNFWQSLLIIRSDM